MSIEALQIVLYHVTPKKLHQFNWRKLSETSPFRALCQLLYIGKLLHVTASLQLCCRALHHEVCTRLASAVAILRAGNLQLLRVAARPFFTESSSFPPHPRQWDRLIATATGFPLFDTSTFEHHRTWAARVSELPPPEVRSPAYQRISRSMIWLWALQSMGVVPGINTASISHYDNIIALKQILLVSIRSAPEVLLGHLQIRGLRSLKHQLLSMIALPAHRSQSEHARLQHVILRKVQDRLRCAH